MGDGRNSDSRKNVVSFYLQDEGTIKPSAEIRLRGDIFSDIVEAPLSITFNFQFSRLNCIAPIRSPSQLVSLDTSLSRQGSPPSLCEAQ